jgi:alanine dehydrogenase
MTIKIGVPKEIKDHEYRVGLVPSCIQELKTFGHEIFVETQAGAGINISDDDYRNAGATIVNTAQEVFDKATLIVKVKEPQPQETAMLKSHHVLFTYLHLAPNKPLTQQLLESGCTAIAYETVTDFRGGLPLLAPMSEVAGRMSIQAGAHCLEKAQGGRGILLGGVPGVKPGKVVVLGGGVVGTNAVTMAVGLEAHVVVIDKSLPRLRELNALFGNKIETVYATRLAIEQAVLSADLVIGGVLVPGAEAPKLVTKEMVARMHKGSVLVDVSIDQGGCFETSRPTTHSHPTYVESGVVHYCVTNMPGGAPRTSTFALNNATLPFVLDLANKGYQKALLENNHLLNGLNVHQGHVTHQAVAHALGFNFRDPLSLLS